MERYTAIIQRAKKYEAILQQVVDYRKAWNENLKQFILDHIEQVLKHTKISAEVEIEEAYENLEAIFVSLGVEQSGIAENINESTKRNIIKNNGTLVFSQLFNGKIQVWMSYPLIEGLMQPKPHKLIGIYAPPEFEESLILQNFDEFFKELIEWENYDDDDPSKQETTRIGFGVPRKSNQNDRED